MSNTSRNKNLLFIIAALLLTNIAVLVYFLAIRKPHEGKAGMPDRRHGLSEVLQKEVGFNDDQVAQYKQMKEEQLEKLSPLFDEMRKAKDSLFRLISDTTVSDSAVNKAAEAIAKRQRDLDLQTFSHFRRVRSLCNSAEQQVKYDSAVLRMFRKMGKPARRGEGDKREKK
jgi:protein CpxP